MDRRGFPYFMVLAVAALSLCISQSRAATGPNPNVNYNVPNWNNSPILDKFIDSLPGLGPANMNNLGQYLPVANPDTITYPGSDYYEIALVEYSEQMHSQMPRTRLRGYVQTNFGTNPLTSQNTVAPAPAHYLGPVIVAQQNRAVRVKFANRLPLGAGGNLFLPVDTTYMGAGFGPLSWSWDPTMQMFMFNGNAEMYKQNRASIPHLHGGFTPWISDGTPHQWLTPRGETTSYPQGASLRNVPDMPNPGTGSATLYWTNQQSARLMFYHDHTYGMTRLNVYAGVAAGYLITDPVEQNLVNTGVIPAEQIPLVIQDKTFVCDATTPTTTDPSRYTAATDPLWDTVHWGGGGSLWFPHVYIPNQDPNAPDGANNFGRWDWGPWFWPPQLPGPNPGDLFYPWPPALSGTPEAFMDTPVVNGTAYPYIIVQPKAYRFRILNACNDRHLNLQVYYVDPANPTEVKMVPAVAPPTAVTLPPNTPPTGSELLLAPSNAPVSPVTGLPVNYWPTTWPTDGRDGGVPDPLSAGSQIIQIGTEGGLLPAPVLIPCCPIGYEYNRRNIVVLNVSTHALFLGPAERADIIIDFSAVPPGSKLILYNDSPAPVPGFDPRIDYYTGAPDQTDSGGAPTTQVGKGPNTRTVMQFRVVGTPSPPFNVAALQSALPTAFKASQPEPIVPQTAFGGGSDTYVRIQDTTVTYAPIGPQTLTSISVINGGAGYTSAPTVGFVGGGGAGAAATASVGFGSVTGVTLNSAGAGYTSAPTVTFTGGGGTGARAITITSATVTADLQPKAIQELFDSYGRMNATLGVEIPKTTITTQTTIPYGYIDPPVFV